MDPLENIDQVLKMIGNSIDDVSRCEYDLLNIDQDFVSRFPDYANPDISKEAKEILTRIKESTKLFRKRTYIRTVFSYFEGIIFAMKRILMQHSENFKSKDLEKLNDTKKISLDDNLKYTFKKYCELRTNYFYIDFNCSEWSKFKECIVIRNKITHPKHSDDLCVKDEDLEKVKDAYEWFFNTLVDIQNHEIH
ncbi:MAG: hypothetical protein Q8940_07225 [Bacteroidota bacterium]|nr:hypothetical protein [Bacteroidota bacterium]